jgi:hypothetical protein
MLWTVFMLFMFAWMLGLVLEFRLGAIPLVIVLTTILAFVNVVRRTAFVKAGWHVRPQGSAKRLNTARPGKP